MRLAAAAAALAAALAGPAAAHAATTPRTPSSPSYTLSLTSDEKGAHWRGHEQVTFQNAAATPLTRVYLRLWDNGITGCKQPAIAVSGFQGGSAGALEVGCSALPIELDTPVPPDGRGRIGFDVAIDVPLRNDRFGRIGGEVLVGNAVPLLAIEDGDGWHLEPYTGIGESFYSQVGHFKVTFDTPADVRLATTGVTTSTRLTAGRAVRVVDAPQVRDFAWVAGPLRESSRIGVHGVRVQVWSLASVADSIVRTTLKQSLAALADYDRSLGRYPYPELDVVLGSFTGFGGMEYPTLVMTQPWDIAVSHEIAHQWWYGIVGDDEYHDPWLDEAFATWMEAHHDGGIDALCARARWVSPLDRVTNGMDFWDEHPREYAATVYSEGACALQALSDQLGADRFAALLKRYVANHRFGWSTTQDFKAAAQQVASTLSPPVDLTSFWAEHRIS